MANSNPLELDERYFEILAQTDMVTLSYHRKSKTYDIWIYDDLYRGFTDPTNEYKSEPSMQQAWQKYMELT